MEYISYIMKLQSQIVELLIQLIIISIRLELSYVKKIQR